MGWVGGETRYVHGLINVENKSYKLKTDGKYRSKTDGKQVGTDGKC